MDIRAESWDNTYREGRIFRQLETWATEGIVADNYRGGKVLDLGCGVGMLAAELSGLGCGDVTGVDFSIAAIDIAKKNSAQAGLTFLDGNLEDSTLYDRLLEQGRFSLIFCTLVYAFIDDKDKFLKNIEKIIDKDGLLVVYVPLKEDVPDKPGICIEREEILKPAVKAGFKVVEQYLEYGRHRLFFLRLDNTFA